MVTAATHFRNDPDNSPYLKNPRIKSSTLAFYRFAGVDFTQIDGLDALNVQTILSEIGLNSKSFPTVKHFTSWLGLCPGQKITGDKAQSSQTHKAVNRAANAFHLAAFSLTRSRSALGAFYRRLKSRLGAPKAITATAHKLARMFY